MPERLKLQRRRLLLSELWNCEHAFDFRCPRQFDALQPTADPAVRFCDACQQSVYLCSTPWEFVEHGNQGHCVAVSPDHTPADCAPPDFIGEPSPKAVARMEHELARMEREAATVRDWWTEVLGENPQFAHEALEEVRRANDELR